MTVRELIIQLLAQPMEQEVSYMADDGDEMPIVEVGSAMTLEAGKATNWRVVLCQSHE